MTGREPYLHISLVMTRDANGHSTWVATANADDAAEYDTGGEPCLTPLNAAVELATGLYRELRDAMAQLEELRKQVAT